MLDRAKIRREVRNGLSNVRTYRQALRTPETYTRDERERMRAWLSVYDELAESLKAENDGDNKLSYINELYGIRHKPIGSPKYINAVSMHAYHMSEDGLRRWRDNAVFIASVLAVKYCAVDLSSDD